MTILTATAEWQSHTTTKAAYIQVKNGNLQVADAEPDPEDNDIAGVELRAKSDTGRTLRIGESVKFFYRAKDTVASVFSVSEIA